MRRAVALDIDGVLLRGKKVLNRAADALQLLKQHKIPHIFVTNGGGCTEASKAQDLTAHLNLQHPVRPEQILLSHTPMKSLAAELANSRVLILGHEGCVEVARSYGFNKVSTVQNIRQEVPVIYPYRRSFDTSWTSSDSSKVIPHAGEPIAAALIIHDPIDWALEIQVLVDVLTNPDGFGVVRTTGTQKSMQQRIPLYACNADLVFTHEYPMPRFTQGAFTEAFRTLFEAYTGSPLSIHFSGKPFAVQYNFAEDMLRKEAQLLNVPEPTSFFGIGDNPLSDIRGANNAGPHWTSILVKTGIFQGEGNDEMDPADVVVPDVLDAVRHIVSGK